MQPLLCILAFNLLPRGTKQRSGRAVCELEQGPTKLIVEVIKLINDLHALLI